MTYVLLLKNYLKQITLALMCLIAVIADAQNQPPVQTEGTDFWFGYMENNIQVPDWVLEVIISAREETEGTIEIPGQNYSQSFSVAANSTTLIEIPFDEGFHSSNEVVDNRGIHITSDDTISVLAHNYNTWSNDATQILTTDALGSSYMVMSYPSKFWERGSEFLIVATEDDTEIEIIPSAETLDGIPAGTPITIQLDQGESYQIQSDYPYVDFTGTVITGLDPCKPFAAFAGTSCAGISVGDVWEPCSTTCDHLFTQLRPINTWGTEFIAIPFTGTLGYTLRLLASEDNTLIDINGSTSTLDSGEFVEFNFLSDTRCISTDKPICVAQFMESAECTLGQSPSGDPSMCILNHETSMITDVVFAPLETDFINSFNLIIVAQTTTIDNISLNGTNVNPGEFTNVSDCSDYSYAQLQLTVEDHHLEAPEGVIAYSYGYADSEFESYIHSVGFTGQLTTNPNSDPDSLMVNCAADSLLLTAEMGGADTYWYFESIPDDTLGTGSELLLSQPFSSGLYIATSCAADEYFYVESGNALDVELIPEDTLLCFGESVQLSATVAAGSGDYSFSWSPEDGLDDSESLNPIASPDETTTYTLTVESGGSCITEQEITIQVNDLSDLNIMASQDSVCSGNTVDLNSMITASSNDFEFSWQPITGLDDPETANPSATVSEDITYTLTITDTVSGCSLQDDIDLFAYESFSLDAGEDLDICTIEGTTLDVSTNAAPPLTWQWNNSAVLDNSEVQSPTLTSNEAVDLEVTLTDGNGCSQSDSVSLSLLYPPQDLLGANVEICSGDSEQLQSSFVGPDYSYLWSNNENSSSITVEETGVYTLAVETPEGCVFSDSIVVETDESLSFDLGPDRSLCEGETADLAGPSNGFGFLWNTGETSASIQVTTSGVYSLTASNDNCSSTDSVTVTFDELPENTLPEKITYCFEVCPDELVLDAGNPGYNYQWNTSASTRVIQVDEPGTYAVQITSPLGCEKSYSTQVLSDCKGRLYVPNAFTPNEDGINDLFGAEGGPVENFELTIWNRWGELIWTAENQIDSWNGSNRRGEYYVPNGVYTYSLSYKYLSGCNSDEPEFIEKTGTVTLIR